MIDSAEHRALALKAAQESIVLLKNDKQLLPLDKTKLKTHRRASARWPTAC